ncbi:MAG TPA: lipoyl(octanoyl) transferase LipB [Bacteroidales bacterium]|jgi:lipoyl(octanoyl) transferase|nr:lipoyl(octanoyl) transferase LipB [Bacteroidales bacterium]HPZ61831.1 lipoyl(octanoyl) transferase LipB [Bacteroidales bacterium]HQD35335.1 lipoyl(octanoyl) transferase LipB [Bacteroidales bacterium]HXK91909.1 lipoyl(octanoyl) transferase LipB [Bacteroidales bacterium]
MKIKIIDIGTKSFEDAYQYQLEKVDELVDKRNEQEFAGCFIYVEHPHVYTLGRHGKTDNLLISEQLLSKINASFVKTDRGGDITYHGPGQIVGYPILDLMKLQISPKNYVFNLEEVIIRVLAKYGIKGDRINGSIGVWLDVDKPKPRKICSIGIRITRNITMHGFALNVNNDLKYFSYINPCGFTNIAVTSIANELAHSVDLEEVKKEILINFQEIFAIQLI